MEKVDDILKQAGYFDKRKVDISDILHMYEEHGYRYNNAQKDFLEKYAYLEIHYCHPIWKQDMLLRINPIESQKAITMDVVEEYNDFLKDNLLIIGDIEQENMTLFMSVKGFYFTGYDDCIINWGADFKSMINKLVTGEKGELQIID